MEMEVPELGGTVTVTRVRPTILVADFPFISASAGMRNLNESTTTSVDGNFDTTFAPATWISDTNDDGDYRRIVFSRCVFHATAK